MELLLKLPRPEYPSNPEVLLSSLAWELSGKNTTLGYEKEKGLVYKKVKPSRFMVTPIIPEGNSTDWTPEMLSIFHKAGLRSDRNEHAIINALLQNLIGTKPARASAYSCVPLNYNMLFFQDLRGICKKNNPARLGKVFNTLYSFGNLGKNSRASAAKLWCQVLINSTKKNKDEIFLSKASKSLIGSKMSPDENLVDTSDFQSPPNWFPKNGTPYHWFASAWNSLCDEEWLDVMPTRRWVDWSSCVLRTALGLCYLWESRFYRNIAFALVNEVSDSQDIFGLNEPLLSWKGKDTKVSARSINSHLNSLVADGQKARRVLESLEGLNLPAPLKDSHSIGDIINAYKKQISSSQKAQLAGCFNQPRDSDSQATHETIVYCLTNRNEWGESADLYSLLKTIKKVNRVVEPASEWLAVIASLNTNKYTHTSTLSDLKAELRTMCIGFSKSVLVSELERLGLSHILNDADDAIEIKAAFLE